MPYFRTALLFLLAIGCGAPGVRRYPLAQVVWHDDDQRLFSPRPAPLFSAAIWDGAENSFFRPASEMFAFRPGREAINVNALDEVPSSSWYTNRLSMTPMTPEEVAAGPCGADFAMPEPWTIVGGKPDGAYPGFQIRDANGVRYLMKPEKDLQHYRPAAAEAIGASMFYAAGYFAPCNRIVDVDPSSLVLDPEAMIERTNGHTEPLSEEHVRQVFAQAWQLPNGRYRSSISRFIEGRPISMWRYEGTLDTDPNDVVPHEHRREVRAMYVLDAWTDHIDSRQENTMAAWMTPTDSGEGYVRHYMIDFGDCFGTIHEWDAIVRRLGHSGYLDFEHIVVDFLTLDIIDRPWFSARYGPAGNVLGYYDVFRFVPDQWRPGYPNPAFDQQTEHDAAWMARIIARFSDEHLRQLVHIGRWGDPVQAEELLRTLIGRRDRILERYLTRLSPLTWPAVRGSELCLQDVAVASGIRERDARRYSARAYAGDSLRELEAPSARLADDSYVCFALPAIEDASPERPVYTIVDVHSETLTRETNGPARVHLYATGAHDMTIVGLERPEGAEAPHP